MEGERAYGGEARMGRASRHQLGSGERSEPQNMRHEDPKRWRCMDCSTTGRRKPRGKRKRCLRCARLAKSRQTVIARRRRRGLLRQLTGLLCVRCGKQRRTESDRDLRRYRWCVRCRRRGRKDCSAQRAAARAAGRCQRCRGPVAAGSAAYCAVHRNVNRAAARAYWHCRPWRRRSASLSP